MKLGEGTGMADGKGENDVSEQIEDEDQLLGLKGDEQNNEQDDPIDNDDTGVEMQTEFDGEMFDIPENDNDEQSDQSQDDDEEELDKEMGELDDPRCSR